MDNLYFVVLRFVGGPYLPNAMVVEKEVRTWLTSLGANADFVHVDEQPAHDDSILRDPPFEDFES